MASQAAIREAMGQQRQEMRALSEALASHIAHMDMRASQDLPPARRGRDRNHRAPARQATAQEAELRA